MITEIIALNNYEMDIQVIHIMCVKIGMQP